MTVTYDFRLISSGVPGMSLVMPMNEEAFDSITGEFDMTILPNGSAPLDNSRLSDFVHLAESAHMACDFWYVITLTYSLHLYNGTTPCPVQLSFGITSIPLSWGGSIHNYSCIACALLLTNVLITRNYDLLRSLIVRKRLPAIFVKSLFYTSYLTI